MKIRKYPPDVIFEFDTMDELREFDTSYKTDSRSVIMKRIAKEMTIEEGSMINLAAIKGDSNEAVGFNFDCTKGHYIFYYKNGLLQKTN